MAELSTYRSGRKLAILRIPRIHLEGPVLKGTDELTLNRAVGHIEDTALPGADGNAGIAGHRDGFFRGLMNVVPGDAIQLESLDGTDDYRIEGTWSSVLMTCRYSTRHPSAR
jgi:sortase A